MLKLYLSSVVIFMIIIYCVLQLARTKLIENGWVGSERKRGLTKLWGLFVSAAVPLLRLVIIGVILYMTTITKADYQTIKEKEKDD